MSMNLKCFEKRGKGDLGIIDKDELTFAKSTRFG